MELSLKHQILNNVDSISTVANSVGTLAGDLQTAVTETTASLVSLGNRTSAVETGLTNEINRASGRETQLEESFSILATTVSQQVFIQTFEYDGLLTSDTYPFSCGSGLQDLSPGFGLYIPYSYKVMGCTVQVKDTEAPAVLDGQSIELILTATNTSGGFLGDVNYIITKPYDPPLINYYDNTSLELATSPAILSIKVGLLTTGGDAQPTIGDIHSKYRVSLFIQRTNIPVLV